MLIHIYRCVRRIPMRDTCKRLNMEEQNQIIDLYHSAVSQRNRLGQKDDQRFRWVKDKTKIFTSIVQVREHILTNRYGKNRDYTKISFDDLNASNYEIEVRLLKTTKQTEEWVNFTDIWEDVYPFNEQKYKIDSRRGARVYVIQLNDGTIYVGGCRKAIDWRYKQHVGRKVRATKGKLLHENSALGLRWDLMYLISDEDEEIGFHWPRGGQFTIEPWLGEELEKCGYTITGKPDGLDPWSKI